jgi:hypothetical protein
MPKIPDNAAPALHSARIEAPTGTICVPLIVEEKVFNAQKSDETRRHL